MYFLFFLIYNQLLVDISCCTLTRSCFPHASALKLSLYLLQFYCGPIYSILWIWWLFFVDTQWWRHTFEIFDTLVVPYSFCISYQPCGHKFPKVICGCLITAFKFILHIFVWMNTGNLSSLMIHDYSPDSSQMALFSLAGQLSWDEIKPCPECV